MARGAHHRAGMSVHSPAGSAYAQGLPAAAEVRAGAEERIALRSAAGAGYLWEAVPAGDSSGVAALRLEVGPPPPQTEPPSNQPAPVTLIIAGREPGQARWLLRLVRPWGAREVLLQHELEVKVTR